VPFKTGRSRWHHLPAQFRYLIQMEDQSHLRSKKSGCLGSKKNSSFPTSVLGIAIRTEASMESGSLKKLEKGWIRWAPLYLRTLLAFWIHICYYVYIILYHFISIYIILYHFISCCESTQVQRPQPFRSRRGPSRG
jgi:hypothetical protein